MKKEFYNYEFTDPNLLNEFEEIKANRFHYIKEWYKPNLIGFFCQIRKVFKITPISIKLNETQKAQDIRELVLYLMILCLRDFHIISVEMKISLDELNVIKDNKELDIKYENEIKTFYESMMIDFLSDTRASLAMQDYFNKIKTTKKR